MSGGAHRCNSLGARPLISSATAGHKPGIQLLNKQLGHRAIAEKKDKSEPCVSRAKPGQFLWNCMRVCEKPILFQYATAPQENPGNTVEKLAPLGEQDHPRLALTSPRRPMATVLGGMGVVPCVTSTTTRTQYTVRIVAWLQPQGATSPLHWMGVNVVSPTDEGVIAVLRSPLSLVLRGRWLSSLEREPDCLERYGRWRYTCSPHVRFRIFFLNAKRSGGGVRSAIAGRSSLPARPTTHTEGFRHSSLTRGRLCPAVAQCSQSALFDSLLSLLVCLFWLLLVMSGGAHRCNSLGARPLISSAMPVTSPGFSC